MNRAILALIAHAAVAATTAHAVPIERGGFFGGDITTLPCTIRVDFTSAAAGPDLATFNVIRAYIADSPDINKTDAWSWGREGEFSLCIAVGEEAAVDRVIGEMRALAPSPPKGQGGPTTVHRGNLKGR